MIAGRKGEKRVKSPISGQRRREETRKRRAEARTRIKESPS
jgi:hypothetical protein